MKDTLPTWPVLVLGRKLGDRRVVPGAARLRWRILVRGSYRLSNLQGRTVSPHTSVSGDVFGQTGAGLGFQFNHRLPMTPAYTLPVVGGGSNLGAFQQRYAVSAPWSLRR